MTRPGCSRTSRRRANAWCRTRSSRRKPCSTTAPTRSRSSCRARPSRCTARRRRKARWRSAVRRGIAEIPTKDQFEKHLLREANHFAKNWSMERWHNYIQGPPPEGFNDAQKFEWQKAATNWQEYVTKAYDQAWDKAEAKLLDNYRRIDVANRAVESNLKFQLAGTFFAGRAGRGSGIHWMDSRRERRRGRHRAQVGDAGGRPCLGQLERPPRKLSTPERVGLGAEAALGAITMGTGYALQRSTAATPRSGSNNAGGRLRRDCQPRAAGRRAADARATEGNRRPQCLHGGARPGGHVEGARTGSIEDAGGRVCERWPRCRLPGGNERRPPPRLHRRRRCRRG